MAKEPWDKLDGEGDEAYARFLIYRNLGTSRSLIKAYHHFLVTHDGFTGGKERLSIPGQWCSDSSTFQWMSRCSAWDIRNLHAYGARIAILHTQAVTKIAEKCVRVAARSSPGTPAWEDVLETVRVLNEYLSPEVVRGIKEKYAKRDEPAVCAGEQQQQGDGIE